MTGRYPQRLIVPAAAVLALLLASPAFAQGKSQRNRGKQARPSASTLPVPVAPLAGPIGATPFAWLDDATLMTPGTVWVGLSLVRWQGGGLSEVSVPVFDAAVGLTPRVQVAASVPRTLDNTEQGGAPGGFGTTFISTKIGLLQDDRARVRVAVAPTIEILTLSALQGSGGGRLQWGLPVSVETTAGRGRVYGSAGFFSRGVRYAGAGAGLHLDRRVAASASFSRAWSSTASPDPSVPSAVRNEIGGGVSYSFTPNVGVFGSIGRTVATPAEYGAGTSLGLGMSIAFSPAFSRTKSALQN
jgi:hypothetical protein